MHDLMQPILPQVPVEGIRVHIARSRLSMGDAVEARLADDGRVGIWARVRGRVLGIPLWRQACLGHLGDVAGQILAPALQDGMPLRLRVVMLTPEHLARDGDPEIHVSIWGDPRLLSPYLDVPEAFAAQERDRSGDRQAQMPAAPTSARARRAFR